MNRIVKEHYPAEKLPADLREGISGDRVTVTVVSEAGARPRAKRGLFGVAKERDTSIAEAVERIRSLRDEWD
jgi:hypothetical protein